MRVVSLLASATEIVCALGAGDTLAGRSHECDNPGWVRRLPRCSEPAFDVSGSSRSIDSEVRRRIRANEPLYRIDTELIRSLAPDLVIAQEHCEVCAITPSDVARTGCKELAGRVLALGAGSLEGIFESVARIGGALGRDAAACGVIAGERERLRRVRERTAGQRRPTLAMLEWTDPVYPMANWGPALVDAANGELLLGAQDQRSSAIPGDWIAKADPEYLIVAPCGFSLDRALAERPVLAAYPWWSSLSAVRAGKVAFADGNLYFNRSGMTVSRTAEIIAEILHGASFGAPEDDAGWCWV
jgi:iron complex transport system substrate-binding protein